MAMAAASRQEVGLPLRMRLLLRCALVTSLLAPPDAAVGTNQQKIPVAIFHGLGADAAIEQHEVEFLTSKLGDTHAFYSLEYAKKAATILTAIEQQARRACEVLKQHPAFAVDEENVNVVEQGAAGEGAAPGSEALEPQARKLIPLEPSKEQEQQILRKPRPDMAIIGHSNGGMVGRWVLQNCVLPRRIRYFISVGGPQRGVISLPPGSVPDFLKPLTDWIIHKAYLWPWMQKLIGPAGYVYNPHDFAAFQNANTFLGKLNNEGGEEDGGLQKGRLLDNILGRGFRGGGVAELDLGGAVGDREGLGGILLIRFLQDEIVVPREAEWFAQYREAEAVEVGASSTRAAAAGEGSHTGGKTTKKLILHSLNETSTDTYKNSFWDDDLIGLRKVDESHRLFFYASAEKHDSLTDEDRMQIVKLLAGEGVLAGKELNVGGKGCGEGSAKNLTLFRRRRLRSKVGNKPHAGSLPDSEVYAM